MKQEKIIDDLEIQLANLAYSWRRLHSQGDFKTSDTLIQQYHSVYRQLLKIGWTGEGLLPDSELPTDLMPKEHVERWS